MSEVKNYKNTGMSEEEFKEFCSVMDGMEEVNHKMVEEMEKNAPPPPMCHFKVMEYDYGLWTCSTCGHTKEDESFIADCVGYEY